MAASDVMGGAVDPETLYTKQSCIGKAGSKNWWGSVDIEQAEGALEKYTKGTATLHPSDTWR